MSKKKEKVKAKKMSYSEDRQKKLLERLGFVQMVFDFYSAPVA